MFWLGIAYPLLILILTSPKIHSWRSIRLFSQYLIISSVCALILESFNAHFTIIYSFLFMWAFFEASNIEHIINNDSNHSISFVRFLFDPVFLKGSGLSKRFILRLIVITIVTISLFWFFRDVSIGIIKVTLLISGAFLITIRKSHNSTEWLQESWFISNLMFLFSKNVQAPSTYLPREVQFSEKLREANLKYEQHVKKDISGEKWLLQNDKKNVLIIMVEGLGKLQMDNGWMPFLKKRSEKNISYENFFSHQRNTNRGVYSVFSGKHPNLVSQIAKPDLVAQYGKMEIGLPEYLGENGYSTSFIQGAPKVFMSKDRFLPALGFQEVKGEEDFSRDVPRIKWGIDDENLYDYVLNEIEVLQNKSSPWFLSLLTVSTHHPFQAHAKKLNTAEEAFLYADSSLDSFLERLEKKGVLDNTLVMITSDEASGDSTHFLTHNLSVLTIIEPSKISKKLLNHFGQSDIAISVCDYLSLDENPFVGRSVFREYTASRPIYFANIFQQKAFCLWDNNILIKNYSGKVESFKISELSFAGTLTKSTESTQDFDSFVLFNDRDLSFLTNPVLMNVSNLSPLKGKVVNAGGAIKIGLKKGESIKLYFSGDNLRGERPVVVLWLIQDMKNKQSFKLNILMTPGKKMDYKKVFTSEDDAWYDISIKVNSPNEENWHISNLQVSIE
jgi:hypothetical protein